MINEDFRFRPNKVYNFLAPRHNVWADYTSNNKLKIKFRPPKKFMSWLLDRLYGLIDIY